MVVDFMVSDFSVVNRDEQKLSGFLKHAPSENNCIVFFKHFSAVISVPETKQKLSAHLLLQGTVIIIANHGDRIDIPAGSMLENKIVSGNLRILDH